MFISKILIIEDNPEILQLLIQGLRDWYTEEIVTATTRGYVLHIIDREEFDIVLMPLYPAGALLRDMILRIKNKPEAPVIIITGSAQARDQVRKIEQSGCHYYPLMKRVFSLREIFLTAQECPTSQKPV
jgi:DNA-binding response OmpR family regulator